MGEHAMKLKESCPGKGSGAREYRRRRFMEGLFSKHDVPWTLGQWWTPTPAAAAWVLACAASRSGKVEAAALREEVVCQDGLAKLGSESTRHMLLRTACLNTEELNTCVNAALAKRAKVVAGVVAGEDDGDFDCGAVFDGENWWK